MFRVGLYFLACFEHVRLSELGFSFMLYFLFHVSGLGFVNKSINACHEHAYAGTFPETLIQNSYVVWFAYFTCFASI